MPNNVITDSPNFNGGNWILETRTSPDGKVIIKGILQRANAKNQNGRIYPRHILEREVNKYVKDFVQRNTALAELDHATDSVINLKNVSHNIKELHWEGDDLIGTIELLSTPCGNIAKELVKNGIPLGISSRGLGSTRQIDESTVEVGDDFSLLCFDLVATPSVQGAYLTEGKVNSALVLQETKINNLIHDFFTEIG